MLEVSVRKYFLIVFNVPFVVVGSIGVGVFRGLHDYDVNYFVEFKYFLRLQWMAFKFLSKEYWESEKFIGWFLLGIDN